jgi:hypothetical protein
MHTRARVVFAGTAMAAVLAISSVVSVSAAGPRFGSRLTPDTQPQPAVYCDEPNDTPPHDDCTWILKEEYSDGPGLAEKAPKAGIIGRVRLMSCTPGNFRVQVARRVSGTDRYRVRKNGPSIQYQGDLDQCDDETYRIEGFATNFSVRRGDRIAIKARRAGTVRCGSGGAATLQFHPPLVAGGNARRPSDEEGCFLLIQWVYK